MPGIINPKGRIHLNETTRDMTPRERPSPTKKANKKVQQIKPFENIKNKENIEEIQKEIYRLSTKTKKKKSDILLLLCDKFSFDKIEAENIYFYSFQRKKQKPSSA